MANAMLSSIFAPDVAWRVMLGLGAVMPVFMLYLSLFVMPETPRFLMKIGRPEDARAIMEKICPNRPQDVDNVMAEMQRATEEKNGGVGISFWKLIRNPDPVIRFMLATVCLVALAQQLSGVECMMYYTPFMLQDVGFTSGQEIMSLTAFMGLAKTATLVFAACMLDAKSSGRRSMLISSYAGMAVSLLLLSIGAFSKSRGFLILGIFGYVVMFSVGAGPITWLFASEIMPTMVRARAMVLAASLNRLTGGIISLTFLSLSGISMGGILLFFSVICTGFTYAAVKYCPETKGRSLEEMYGFFSALVESRRRKHSGVNDAIELEPVLCT